MQGQIWTKTQPVYLDPKEDKKPLPKWGSVRYPICLECGNFCMPAFDNNKARCPHCHANVDYTMVPEDKLAEAREEIRNKNTGAQ